MKIFALFVFIIWGILFLGEQDRITGRCIFRALFFQSTHATILAAYLSLNLN